MQDSGLAGGAARTRLANPFLDLATVTAEAQLKFWEAYQVEGSMFVAKRMRADLEHMRALGHCSDAQAIGECQMAWFSDLRKDYAEEMARLAGTVFSLGVSGMAPLGGLFTKRRP
ncbi:MAG TPA: hypothetical protein VMW57_02555 [Methyloceanibacter sp.]|nr:hypothetical protein [Methyloceanibacter sp.]